MVLLSHRESSSTQSSSTHPSISKVVKQGRGVTIVVPPAKKAKASLVSSANFPIVVDSDDSIHTVPGGKDTDSESAAPPVTPGSLSRSPSAMIKPDDAANLGKLGKSLA